MNKIIRDYFITFIVGSFICGLLYALFCLLTGY